MTPLVLGLALAIAAPAPKKADEESPGKIDGEWVVESIEGPPKGGPPLGMMKFRFIDGKLQVSDGARKKEEAANYTVDLTKKPANIDIRPEVEAKEVAVMGIIEIKGDTLKLCFGKLKNERPTDFKGNAEKGIMLFTMKRVKPEK